MSIRWPYCREYETNPNYGRTGEFCEARLPISKKIMRMPVYHTKYSCVVQDQVDMDEKVKKVCNVVFAILAIGALVGIGIAIGRMKYR